MNHFKILGKYSFDTFDTVILGNNFKPVTVVSIMDYRIASNFADVQALHSMLYSSLPVGTQKDFTKLTYILVRNKSNEEKVVAVEWIRLDTIKEHVELTANVKISNVQISDADVIRRALIASGFDEIEVSIG